MRAIVAALAIALLGSTAAGATTAQGAPDVDLSLAGQTAWVRPDQPFEVRLDVDRVRQPAGLTIEVGVHRAVTSRSQFARTIDGELLGRTVHEVELPFDDLPFDTGGALPLRIPLPSGLRPGVYPVSIVARGDDGDAVASLHTHAIRVPDEPAAVPLSVAWVQDYAADPALAPDGTVALDDDALDQLRVIADQLDRGLPLTVRPVPETIDALGTIEGEQTVGALAELLRGHQVLWSSFVDLDLAALVEAGLDDDIADQRVAGAAVLDDLDLEADPRTWVSSGTVTGATLDELAAVGVHRIALEEEALEPLDPDLVGGITLARPFGVESAGRTLDAVVVDRGLTSHFEGGDEVLAAHHLLADLAVLHFDSPGLARGLVVRPPDDWTPTDAFLDAALDGLASSPLLEPVTLDGLFDAVEPLTDDGEPVVRSLAEEAGAPALGFPVSALEQARASIRSFRTLTEPANPTSAELDRLLLVALSADLSGSERSRYLRAVTSRVAEAASNVRVLGDRSYRLTAREGTVPLTLVNDNDFEVVVDVELSSDKLAFTDAAAGAELGTHRLDDVVLGGGETITRAVPVKARTSGTSSLRVAMHGPDGGIELARTSITITSTFASWVGIVLSLGAAAFLMLWWASHFRTVRRARKLVPPE